MSFHSATETAEESTRNCRFLHHFYFCAGLGRKRDFKKKKPNQFLGGAAEDAAPAALLSATRRLMCLLWW